MARRRPTQEERKAKTRERLLDSAERVCRKRGYHAASVEEIAGRAGYSTGAVYAHFRGKDDLVLAVVERRLERQAAEIATATADRRGDDRLAAGAELWTAVLRSDRDFIVFFVELWAVAVRDRALRVRLAAANRRIRSALGELIASEAAAAGEDAPPASAERLALALDVIADGFALHRIADPDGVPEEHLATYLRWLVTGARADLEREPPD